MGILYNYYRLKYRYGKYLNLKKPVDVSLELSSLCNMSCSYCYHSDKKNLPFKMKLMSKETAFKIIEDAAIIGVHSIKINGKGESTLNKHYTEIATHIKNLSHGLTFIDRIANSNFKILPNVRADKFIGLAQLTKVKVSYDSFDKGVFEFQRTGGDHNLTTENIDLFYNHSERIKSETQLVIQAVRTNLNKDEDLEHLIKTRWPEAEASIRDMVTGRIDSDKSNALENIKRKPKRVPCKQAFVRLIYNSQGEAFPCCPDYKEQLKIGDSKHQNINKIFNGKKANALRDSLCDGSAFVNREACKDCSSFESYENYKAPWGS